MGKQRLQCDICGGNIEMQAGGKHGICANCGTTYSVERMREIYSGIKVSITGTEDDIVQWKTLVNTYLQNCDYVEAEKVVKKILEAVPSDPFANDIYPKIQEWKHFEVVDGVLVRYHGQNQHVVVPNGIKRIGRKAFGSGYAVGGVAPNAFGEQAPHVVCVEIPSSVKVVEGGKYDGAFYACYTLQTVRVAEGLQTIGEGAFYSCHALRQIDIPSTVYQIGADCFVGCEMLESEICLNSVQSVGAHAFRGCSRIPRIILGNELKQIGEYALDTNGATKIEYSGLLNLDHATGVAQKREQEARNRANEEERRQRNREDYRRRGRCQHCGGTFTGLIFKHCSQCGQSKDY